MTKSPKTIQDPETPVQATPSAETDHKAKMEDVRAIIKDLNKQYDDKDFAATMKDAKIDIETWPTGSIGLDFAIGCNGLPKGRIIHITGQSGQGKSSLALDLMAKAQAQGELVALIDVEHAPLKREHMKKFGIDLDTCVYVNPTTGEAALNTLETLLKTEKFAIITLDSVAALIPEHEAECEIEDQNVASQARLLGRALKRLVLLMRKSKTTVILVNQLRDKISPTINKYTPFADKVTCPGGSAVRYYCSVWLDVHSTAIKNDAKDVTGSKMTFKNQKSKCGPSFRQSTLTIDFATGIQRHVDLLEWADARGIVKKTGNTYKYGEVTLGVGAEKAAEALLADPEMMAKVEAETRKAVFEVKE